MRVYLTGPELAHEAGKELLTLATRIAADGELDLAEIKELRHWLLANRDHTSIAAIGYLTDIMTRITADGVIDQDERLELHLAVERVIPAANRTPLIEMRKKRVAEAREQAKERHRIEKDNETAELKRLREQEQASRTRLQHTFSKVAGVTFPNDDGSERQQIIKRCKPGEQLLLRHEPQNAYSEFAVQVLRSNGQQLGHAPEYLAERICNEREDGRAATAFLVQITGGSFDKPTRGANVAVFFAAQGVTNQELQTYAKGVLATELLERSATSPQRWWKWWWPW